MSVRLPEVPASFSVTLSAVAGLAFVFAHARRAVAVTRAARAAADGVRREGARLAQDVGKIAALKEEIAAHSPVSPGIRAGEVSLEAEALLDVNSRVQAAFQDAVEAASKLDRAIEGTRPFATNLERSMPGWRQMTGKLHESLLRLQPDLERSARIARESVELAGVNDSAKGLLFRSLAEQGMSEWASSLPNEDEPLVDEEDGEPIRWDLERGWQPGPA